ncbi:hypothetical protein K1T71_009578 [Dendrolimus kikuchii]|uniref:Uncharacterized protein n=1 Tax=Dendrolimus kikuchii TaxID=765133 RepID=A0ACC1CSR6_9NEOP|nr:hypothetical protein K1T71_009578 [Dendrolimus kikuchii]
MGKRKRSNSDIVDRVLKKVKKLVNTKRRRLISSSSSSSSEEDNSVSSAHLHSHYSEAQANEIPPAPFEEQFIAENTELDPEILQLLGSDPTENKSFGENLHRDLATRWKHILTNGLPKDDKIDLLKQYLPAENLLQHLKTECKLSY